MITGDASQAIRALRSVREEIEWIRGSTQRAQRASRDWQDSLKNAKDAQFRFKFGMPGEDWGSGGGFNGKNAGRAGRQFGGSIGRAAGQFGEAMGLGGAFGRVFAAVAVVGIAWRMLDTAIRENIQNIRSMAAAAQSFTDSVGKGKEKLGAQALAGAEQAPILRPLIATMGDHGMNVLKQLTGSGLVSQNEAASSLAKVYQQSPGEGANGRSLQQANMVNSAYRLVEMGATSFSEAINEALKQAPVFETDAGTEFFIKRMIIQKFGITGDDADKYIQRANKNESASRFLSEAKQTTGRLSVKQEIERARTVENQGGQVAAEKLIQQERDPVGSAIREQHEMLQKQVDHLSGIEEGIKAQYPVMTGIQKFLETWGGRSVGKWTQALDPSTEARKQADQARRDLSAFSTTGQ